MSAGRETLRRMPLERKFYSCPQCGATVAESLVDFHDRYHDALDEALDTDPDAGGVELQPWPARHPDTAAPNL